MSRRTLGGFIIINILVSLGMVFLALNVWSLVKDDEPETAADTPAPRPIVVTATQRPGELPAVALQGTITALETQVAVGGTGSDDGSAIGSINTPTDDENRLPTLAPTAIPQGVPTLDPTVIARVTLPFSDGNPDDAGDAGTGDDGGDDNPIIDGCERYTVVSGDTCIAIAVRFDVGLEELITLNQLDANCATLRVDQVLRIPSASCAPPPTATITPTITNTPFAIGTFSITNTPVPTAVDATVQIRQILNFGDVTLEQVDIENTSDGVVSLEDWTLRDADGNVFTFPDVLMQPGQIIRIFTRSGQNTPAALFWNNNTPLWSFGETALLQDATGIGQSVFTVGGEPIDFGE